MAQFSFSQRSQNRLHNVHPDLVTLCEAAIKTNIMDFSIIEGARSITRQQDLFVKGKSKTMNSRHLIQADGYAHAVDLYPYPINMAKVHAHNAQEISRFGVLSGIIQTLAHTLYKEGVITHSIRWGGDWNQNGQTLDHTFFDAPHFELYNSPH